MTMKVGVLANDAQKEELLLKQNPASIVFDFKNSIEELISESEADALFILREDIVNNKLPHIPKPVFINSVMATLKELNAPKNVYRINGWTTFIKRGIWEIASEDEQGLRQVMGALQYQYTSVKDEPGFVAARVISMI